MVDNLSEIPRNEPDSPPFQFQLQDLLICGASFGVYGFVSHTVLHAWDTDIAFLAAGVMFVCGTILFSMLLSTWLERKFLAWVLNAAAFVVPICILNLGLKLNLQTVFTWVLLLMVMFESAFIGICYAEFVRSSGIKRALIIMGLTLLPIFVLGCGFLSYYFS